MKLYDKKGGQASEIYHLLDMKLNNKNKGGQASEIYHLLYMKLNN